jgi:hypothetical protein
LTVNAYAIGAQFEEASSSPTISATAAGVAFATFRVPLKTSGVAHIVATVGSVRAEKRIDVGVNC